MPRVYSPRQGPTTRLAKVLDIDAPPKLTRCQKDVVKWLCEGLKNDDIADRLHLSPNTVNAHLANIYRTYKFADRWKASAYFMKNEHEWKPD